MFFPQQRVMPRILRAPDGEGAGGGGDSSGQPDAAAVAAAAAAAAAAAEHPAGNPPAGDAKPWWDGKITEPEIVEYAKTKNYANGEEALRAAWSANKMNKLEPAVQAYMEGKATPEQEAAVLNKLRPETADKYDFKHPDGVVVDKELEGLGRNIFHKLGVPQAKAQEAMDMWNKAVTERGAKEATEAQAANDKALTDLTTAWGPDLDKNRAAGERVMKALDLKPDFMEKIEGQIGSADVVELLAKIGRKSDEGAFKGGNDTALGDPNNVDAMTPEVAAARIKVLQGDAAFQTKYTDKNHAENKDSIQLMERLFAKAGPLANK